MPPLPIPARLMRPTHTLICLRRACTMQRDVVVRFKFFRSFVGVAFLLNAAAFFASAIYNPFFSYGTVLLTLGWFGWCIRCANCGKSPFIKWAGAARIGIPIPERKCSKCGRDFRSTEPVKLE
jgi:hypothetical protein